MIVWIQNPFDNLPHEGYRKQRYWLMSEAFVRAGCEVVLWTSDFNHMRKQKRELMDGERFGDCGVELQLIPTLPYVKNVGLTRIRSHVRYAKEWFGRALRYAEDNGRPDLIVSSVPSISGAEVAVALGKRLGARVVVDVMDAWPETFERLAPRGTRWLARQFLGGLYSRINKVYREADLVTGVCDRYQSLVGRDDYYRAYHGIDIDNMHERLPFTHSGLRLVYAGNLGRTYDLGTVIRGVSCMRNEGVTLDVAGKGQNETRWRALVEDLGLDDKVRFHGYLEAEKLRELLESCDIGIVPMPEESFVGMPYKFADYSSAGLGIVSSLGGESAAMLARYRVGCEYRVGDVRGFVAAVHEIAAEREGLKERSVGMAEQEFDATLVYDGYVARVKNAPC